MRKSLAVMAVLCVGVAGAVFAGSLFTDVSQHTAPGMVTQINAAFDAIEDSIDGTSKINGSFQDVAVAGNGTVSSNLTVTGGLTLTGPVQLVATDADGYSYNLVALTSVGSGANLRGWRVNLTSSNAATLGDMQCVHGYLTAGTTPTFAANAAVYPLSAWLDVPDTATLTGPNVVAGIRVIVDPNNNDMSAIAGGGESALFYGQTWASTGKIEHGLRVIAGAGTYIKNMLSIGGSGTFGTIIDITECGADTHLNLFGTGLQSAGARPWKMGAGDATTSATVGAAMGATCGEGSIYWSTTGKGYIKAAHTGVDSADWVVFTTSTSSAD